MQVLLTGVAGYIGTVVAGELLAHGHRVLGIDALHHGGASLLGTLDRDDFEFQRGDVADFGFVRAAFARQHIDAVVHFAGIVGDRACAEDTQLSHHANVEATRNLVSLTRDARAGRFVFASSCSVYGGAIDNGTLTDEQAAPNPLSLYAEQKLIAEKLIEETLAKEGPCHPTILRLATAHGISARMRFDLALNAMSRDAASRGTIRLTGGEHWRPFCHIRDIARAVRLVLQSPHGIVASEVFNVGDTSENYQMKQIAAAIIAANQGCAVTTDANVDDRRSYRVSFEKIANALGFRRSLTVHNTIAGVREAVRQGVFGQAVPAK